MTPPAPAPVPELMDDLVEEILLRLPSDDPAGLVHVTLVCKRWRRIVSYPSFRRRLRELLHHRAHPPMLGGFLYNMSWVSRFVPTSSLYLHHHAEEARRRDGRALDARHGRVLLHGVPKDVWTNPLDAGLLVWDPASDHVATLPKLPREAYGRTGSLRSWNATVLCAGGGGACDRRLGCGRRPFIVVVVGGNVGIRMYSCVYSSEDGAWSNRTYAPGDVLGPHCEVEMAMPTALVGRSLYFSDRISRGIIRFNVDTRELSAIPLLEDCLGNRTVLMTTEGGGRLGLVTVLRCSKLLLFSGVPSPDGEVVGWEMSRVIELEKVIHVGALSPLNGRHVVIGVADDIGVIFLRTDDGGIFTLDLNSGHVKKVYKDTKDTCIYRIFPCVSFNC
ncbi:unnamed protein product [Urochloa humidicola]